MSLSTLINDHKSLMVVASMFEFNIISHWFNGVHSNSNHHYYQSYWKKIDPSTIVKNKILSNRKWCHFNYKNRLKLIQQPHSHSQSFTLNLLFIFILFLLINSYLKNLVQAINIMHHQTADRYFFNKQHHLIRPSFTLSINNQTGSSSNYNCK